jgi:hypothetical protein
MASKSSVSGFAFYWLPVLAYAGLVFLLSSIPSAGLPKWGFDMSILHVPLFFGLSYLILRALPGRGVPLWRLFALSIAVSTLYGVTDELHQLFVPGRTFSLVDMLFDFIGSSLILFKIRASSNHK